MNEFVCVVMGLCWGVPLGFLLNEWLDHRATVKTQIALERELRRAGWIPDDHGWKTSRIQAPRKS